MRNIFISGDNRSPVKEPVSMSLWSSQSNTYTELDRTEVYWGIQSLEDLANSRVTAKFGMSKGGQMSSMKCYLHEDTVFADTEGDTVLIPANDYAFIVGGHYAGVEGVVLDLQREIEGETMTATVPYSLLTPHVDGITDNIS